MKKNVMNKNVMNNGLWVSSLAAVIMGISLGSVACRADTVAPSTSGLDAQNSYSAAALYNLGNSYARQGKPALAVLSYERARILAPRDPDIRANLRQVRESAALNPESSGYGDPVRWFRPDTTYWIGFGGLLLAGMGWLLLCLKKPYRIVSRAAMGAGLLLMAFTVGDALAIERLMHRSVVLQTVATSAAPISGAETIFTVPQAAIVQREDEHAGFTLIRDSNGRVGWVSRSQLIPIINPRGEVDAKT